MPLPTSSLAKICNQVREHLDTLGQTPSPPDWDVTVTIGAPGINLPAVNNTNTLNLFFYRFEPFTFETSARPGDVQWIKMFCVITAVGMTDDLVVMIAAVVLSTLVMAVAAEPLSNFIADHPTTKMLALAFILLVGVALVADGLGFHIPRGYLYFAIAFSLGVELLNIQARKKAPDTGGH